MSSCLQIHVACSSRFCSQPARTSTGNSGAGSLPSARTTKPTPATRCNLTSWFFALSASCLSQLAAALERSAGEPHDIQLFCFLCSATQQQRKPTKTKNTGGGLYGTKASAAPGGGRPPRFCPYHSSKQDGCYTTKCSLPRAILHAGDRTQTHREIYTVGSRKLGTYCSVVS